MLVTREHALIETSRQCPGSGTSEAAIDFVRFCHRRRRVGWPELYDEMCAVARRGLYHGWGFPELAEHGIAFGLAEMPELAALVADVCRQDVTRTRRAAIAVMTPAGTGQEEFENRAGDWERPVEVAVAS